MKVHDCFRECIPGTRFIEEAKGMTGGLCFRAFWFKHGRHNIRYRVVGRVEGPSPLSYLFLPRFTKEIPGRELHSHSFLYSLWLRPQPTGQTGRI